MTPASSSAPAHHPRLAAGIACGVGAGALWGLVFLAPQLLHDFSPLQLSASRYLAYGAVALAVLAPRWRRAAAALGAAEWWALVRLSVLGNLLYYVLVGRAVQWAGAPATSLIVGMVPVVVTLASARAEGARGMLRLAGPTLLCVAGMGLVGLQSLGSEHAVQPLARRVAGLACAFGALLSWSAYSLSNARWLSRRANISPQDWSLLTGVVTGALALLQAVPAFAFDAGSVHVGADWLRFWGVAALLAVLASVVGNALWNGASRLLPLSLMGQMIVFETVFALLYGCLWERRLPGVLELAALACLLVGVLWCAWLHLPRRARV